MSPLSWNERKMGLASVGRSRLFPVPPQSIPLELYSRARSWGLAVAPPPSEQLLSHFRSWSVPVKERRRLFAGPVAFLTLADALNYLSFLIFSSAPPLWLVQERGLVSDDARIGVTLGVFPSAAGGIIAIPCERLVVGSMLPGDRSAFRNVRSCARLDRLPRCGRARRCSVLCEHPADGDGRSRSGASPDGSRLWHAVWFLVRRRRAAVHPRRMAAGAHRARSGDWSCIPYADPAALLSHHILRDIPVSTSATPGDAGALACACLTIASCGCLDLETARKGVGGALGPHDHASCSCLPRQGS